MGQFTMKILSKLNDKTIIRISRVMVTTDDEEYEIEESLLFYTTSGSYCLHSTQEKTQLHEINGLDEIPLQGEYEDDEIASFRETSAFDQVTEIHFPFKVDTVSEWFAQYDHDKEYPFGAKIISKGGDSLYLGFGTEVRILSAESFQMLLSNLKEVSEKIREYKST